MPLAERTLAKPLSGTEVIEAIVTSIRRQLSKDCYLAPHMAYGSYSFQADLQIQFQASRITGTQTHVTGGEGELDPEKTESANISISDEPKPPNEVRVDSGQPVPTLTKTPAGRVEERAVKYERRPPKQKTPVGA